MRLIISLILASLLVTAFSQNHTRQLRSPYDRPIQHGFSTRHQVFGAPARIHGVPAGYAAGPSPVGGYAPQGFSPQSAVGFAAPQGGAGFAPQGAAGGSFSSANDFNPLLAGGVRGYPGIKARINQRGFQYFSSLIAPILDQEIKSARIPPISQCIPEVNGCVQVYNLYVSRYRCPQRVVIYPAPPNQVVIAVQNLDIGVTGNLGGQINILLPLKLFGIVEVNAHQVSITVQLAITRGPTGGPYIQVVGCQASVGYLDAYIVNGGLIGDIANSQFRGQISNKVRQMIPQQLCAQIPGIVNSKLNGRLGGLPQSIPLTQILQVAGGALGLGGGSFGGGSAGGCGAAPAVASTPCHAAQKTPQVSRPLPLPTPAVTSTKRPQLLPSAPQSNAPRAQTSYAASNTPPAASYAPPPIAKSLPHATNPYSRRHVILSGTPQADGHPISSSHLVNSASTSVVPRVANRFVRDTRPHAKSPHSTATVVVARGTAIAPGYAGGAPASGFAPGQVSGGSSSSSSSSGSGGIQFIQPGEPSPCGGCPGSANTDPLSQIQEITKYLDINKLNDIYLSVQLLQTFATSNDYTIDLTGEFSQGGQGGTPFYPFPMQFPSPVGSKMAEALISDYTINTLFYSLHRKGFLSVRLGPETPKIGPLLKTTCSDDSEEGLEDHGVETDETKRLRKVRSALAPKAQGVRNARQSDGGLSDLGICFGDILPVARQRFPNRNIIIQLHTLRAPSVILSARNGGTATLDLSADADLFTDSNEKIGTIRVEGTFEVQIQTSGNRLTGHGEITNLRLTNPDQSLGLSQEALDNLGNLGKELVGKAANDVLQRGIPLSLPSGSGGLPLNFNQPQFRIMEHAIYLESDFTISPSFISQLTGGSGGGYGGVCRR